MGGLKLVCKRFSHKSWQIHNVACNLALDNALPFHPLLIASNCDNIESSGRLIILQLVTAEKAQFQNNGTPKM